MAIFDEEAVNYDEWYKTRKGVFIDEIETKCLFDLFKAKKGMKVLDVGCGTGIFSIKLAKLGCRVVGIDISDKMLEKAKEKAMVENLDIEFLKMDACKLDFADETFDAAISVAVLEFVLDYSKFLDEMFRVVKKNGRIVVGTINKDSKWGKLYKSEAFSNTVFKHASFKNPEMLGRIHSDELMEIRECLFIPPDLDENSYNMENELKYSKQENGGFICALWIKG